MYAIIIQIFLWFFISKSILIQKRIFFFLEATASTLSKKLWQGRFRSQSVVLNNSLLWVTGGTVKGELIKDTEIVFDMDEKPIRVTDLFAATTGHAIVLGIFWLF